MWQKVATEMGIPWRSAESMHWQLGEQEMSSRANAPVFHLHPSATDAGPSLPSKFPVDPTKPSHRVTVGIAAQLTSNRLPILPQRHQPAPQIHAITADDLVSGASIAPVPGLHSDIKSESASPRCLNSSQEDRPEHDLPRSPRSDPDARRKGHSSLNPSSQCGGARKSKKTQKKPDEHGICIPRIYPQSLEVKREEDSSTSDVSVEFFTMCDGKGSSKACR